MVGRTSTQVASIYAVSLRRVGAVVTVRPHWYVGVLDLGPDADVIRGARRLSFVRWDSMSDAAKAQLSIAAESCWVAVDDRNGPGCVPCATWEELVDLAGAIFEADGRKAP